MTLDMHTIVEVAMCTAGGVEEAALRIACEAPDNGTIHQAWAAYDEAYHYMTPDLQEADAELYARATTVFEKAVENRRDLGE